MCETPIHPRTANNPQQHTQYDAFTAMIHDLTGNESGDQTQKIQTNNVIVISSTGGF